MPNPCGHTKPIDDGCKDKGCDHKPKPKPTPVPIPTAVPTVTSEIVVVTTYVPPACAPHVIITGIEPRDNCSPGKVRVANKGCAPANNWSIVETCGAKAEVNLAPGESRVIELDGPIADSGVVTLKDATGTKVDERIYAKPNGMVSYVLGATWRWVIASL